MVVDAGFDREVLTAEPVVIGDRGVLMHMPNASVILINHIKLFVLWRVKPYSIGSQVMSRRGVVGREPAFGYRDDAIWLRLELHSSATQSWRLWLAHAFLREVDVWLVAEDGPPQHLLAQDAASPFDSRPLPFRHLLAGLDLQAGSRQWLYVRYRSSGNTALRSYLVDTRTFVSEALTARGGRHWLLLHAWAVTLTVSSTAPRASTGTLMVPTRTTCSSHTISGVSEKSKTISSPGGKAWPTSGQPSGTCQATEVGTMNSSPGFSVLTSEAPLLAQDGPRLEVISDQWANDLREVVIRFKTSLHDRLYIILPNSSLQAITVSDNQRTELADSEEWWLRFDGMPLEGLDIIFEFSTSTPIRFYLVEEKTGLPSFPGYSTQPESGTMRSPGEFLQGDATDFTAIYRQIEIPGY